jgi:hypothetical protein
MNVAAGQPRGIGGPRPLEEVLPASGYRRAILPAPHARVVHTTRGPGIPPPGGPAVTPAATAGLWLTKKGQGTEGPGRVSLFST